MDHIYFIEDSVKQGPITRVELATPILDQCHGDFTDRFISIFYSTFSRKNGSSAPSVSAFTVSLTLVIYPVVNDRWGATDVATLSLHFILFSASLTASQNFNPVHSAMFFSQRFFWRPLFLPPCTVPCKIVLASPGDLDTCPNHFNLHFFTVVKKSS